MNTNIKTVIGIAAAVLLLVAAFKILSRIFPVLLIAGLVMLVVYSVRKKKEESREEPYIINEADREEDLSEMLGKVKGDIIDVEFTEKESVKQETH